MRNNIFLISAFPFEKCCDICKLDLQFFGEDGGTSQGTTGESVSGEQVKSTVETETKKPTGEELSRAVKRQARAAGEKQYVENPLAKVKYGKQPHAADEVNDSKADMNSQVLKTTTEETAQTVNKAEMFEQMIRGEYKEQFQNRTQGIINQRFKEFKSLQAKSQKADTLIDTLARRYGVDSSDFDAIAKASALDESYTEQQAKSRGLSVDEMRKMKMLESENARLRGSVRASDAQKAADKIYGQWMQDSEKMKTIYPDFNFKNEIKNSEFSKLLRSGVSLRKAYEASHLDNILGGAMQYTADQVAKGMVARIADRSGRPSENGTTPRAGVIVKNDVSGLSRSDREEIERRVMRGEKILF